MSEKKKRKASDISAAKLQQQENSYECIVQYEENESKNRSPQQDLALFHKTCVSLKEIFDELLLLKSVDSERNKCEILEKQREGLMNFVLLKKLNRLEKYRIKAGRNALQNEKIRVDSNRLHLQNLLYEASHLKREIHHCYLFKSQDEDIDLVTEEDFYENALESIARPASTKNDEHARRLARLEWELHQRKELSSLCKELIVVKENVTKEISLKIGRLNSLAPCLKTLLKATKPLQDALEMKIEKEWEIQKSIKLLPRPLYLVYMNVTAYAEACDPNIKITIEGDENEARQQEEEDNTDNEDDQDSDNEEFDVKTRKKPTRYNKHELYEMNKKKILKPHPLYITFTLTNKFKIKGSLSISLYYFPILRFITATSNTCTEQVGATAMDILSSDNIVNGLFDSDFGTSSPNPKTKYQLQEYSITESECLLLLKENKHGKPYRWCQRICGIEFVEFPFTSEAITSTELIQNSLPASIKILKNRLRARLNLFQNIYLLESKNMNLILTDENFSRVRFLCSLVQWTSLSWEDYSAHPATQKFVKHQCANMHNVFYRALITRGSAKLECLISIPWNFPIDNPLWSFCISWNGIYNAENSPAIKDMEYWTNNIGKTGEKIPSSILSAQLARTMCSLDIFLETETSYNEPSEFTQEKTFLKSFSHRTQSRPFRLVDNDNSIVFKQFF